MPLANASGGASKAVLLTVYTVPLSCDAGSIWMTLKTWFVQSRRQNTAAHHDHDRHSPNECQPYCKPCEAALHEVAAHAVSYACTVSMSCHVDNSRHRPCLCQHRAGHLTSTASASTHSQSSLGPHIRGRIYILGVNSRAHGSHMVSWYTIALRCLFSPCGHRTSTTACLPVPCPTWLC